MKTKRPLRRQKKVDNQFCPNHSCPDYGVQGRGNVYVTTTYANGQKQMLRCRTCGTRFAETRHTPLFHLHYPKTRVAQVFKALAEGNSIRATSRIWGISKDTIGHWLDRLGAPCKGLHAYLVHDLQLTEVQLDELWTFIKKKRRTSPP